MNKTNTLKTNIRYINLIDGLKAFIFYCFIILIAVILSNVFSDDEGNHYKGPIITSYEYILNFIFISSIISIIYLIYDYYNYRIISIFKAWLFYISVCIFIYSARLPDFKKYHPDELSITRVNVLFFFLSPFALLIIGFTLYSVYISIKYIYNKFINN